MSRLVRSDASTNSTFTFATGPVRTTDDAVSPSTTGGTPAKTQLDNYTARIVKYIPAEVIAFYLAADKLFQSQVGSPTEQAKAADLVGVWIRQHNWQFSLWTLALIAVPLYYWMSSEKGQNVVVNAATASVAFVIWSYATQGSVYFYDANHIYYNSTLASFLLLVFTFFAGLIVPGTSQKK